MMTAVKFSSWLETLNGKPFRIFGGEGDFSPSLFYIWLCVGVKRAFKQGAYGYYAKAQKRVNAGYALTHGQRKTRNAGQAFIPLAGVAD